MVDTVAFSRFWVAALPARSTVDVALQVFERWVLPRRRHSPSIALAELETEVDILREWFAARPFGGLPTCRRTRFERPDQSALQHSRDEPLRDLVITEVPFYDE